MVRPQEQPPRRNPTRIICFSIIAMGMIALLPILLDKMRFHDGRDPLVVQATRDRRQQQIVDRVMSGKADPTKGRAVFDQHCATCHNHPEKAPTLQQSLRGPMPAGHSLVTYVAESVIDALRVERASGWTTVMGSFSESEIEIEDLADAVAFVVASARR